MNKLAHRMVRLNRNQTRTEALLYLQKHGLGFAHAYMSFENPSAVIPYHNTDHCLTAVKWCGRLANLCHTWTLSSERGLMLAALFHDFDHSGGKVVDAENIKTALAGLDAFVAIHKRHFTVHSVTVAREVIECTVYPFTVEPKSYEQKIMRDADVLQMIDIDFENILGEQLRAEIAVSRGEPVSRKQFAIGEIAFLDTIEMYTEPGQVLWAANKPILIERFTEIAGL